MAYDLVALLLQQLQIIAVELDRQFAFDAADRLLHVVGDGLGKVPDHARHLLQFAIHGADQFFFVLVEGGPPLLLGQQIDKIFGVEKAGRIGAVVGPSHLADHLRHFRKGGENDTRLIHRGDAGGRAGAGRQRAAHPDRAFIQVGQKLRADDSTQTQKTRQHQRAARRHRR